MNPYEISALLNTVTAAHIIPESIALALFSTLAIVCLSLGISSLLTGSASAAMSFGVAEPWHTNTLMLDYIKTGFGLLLGTVSLSFSVLWLRVQRLRYVVQQRDRQIDQLLYTDALTGLANQKQLERMVAQRLSAHPPAEISLIYIDIDRFRSISEAAGYKAADKLLLQLSHRFQLSIRPQDTLARIGGDEFAVLLASGDRDDVCQYAERLLHSLSQPFRVQGRQISLMGSAGVASAPQSATKSLRQLLNQADIAMLAAKAAPSLSAVKVFHSLMEREAHSQAWLRCELKLAIARQELRVHYQPIVNLKTSQTIGFEALVRWQHPKQGLLPPGIFLPLAEEMGLSVMIDRWVMQTACEQMSWWQSQADVAKPSLSVNLSADHLSQSDLVPYVRGLLAQYQIAPHQLNLEITEQSIIADFNQAMESLWQLKGLGLTVSLDDFGTGYSSFAYLQRFPVDILKIDRSFVRCLGTPEMDAPFGQPCHRLPPDQSAVQSAVQYRVMVVEAILDWAEQLGIRVVAEGIERSDQLAHLQQMHCHYGQGHLFSRAINAPYAEALLARKSA